MSMVRIVGAGKRGWTGGRMRCEGLGKILSVVLALIVHNLLILFSVCRMWSRNGCCRQCTD